ncbi:hypothetical protein QWO81_24110, partial [Salmonella enterica subsp. enterica serovar Typhimurium]
IAVCEEIEPIKRHDLFVKLFTDRDASVFLPLRSPDIMKCSRKRMAQNVCELTRGARIDDFSNQRIKIENSSL